jgi:site-specific recombinase XerD
MLGRTAPEQWTFRITQESWIGKRNTPRFSQHWKPFDGALSASSVRHTLTIVSSLFEWLVRVQYFAFNPWDVVAKKPASQVDAPEDLELTRVFSEGQWEYLNDHLAAQPDDPHTRRLRFVLPFAYATGMRLSELVDATTGRLYTMPVRKSIQVRWMLKVRGKGGRWRAVPVPDSVMTAIHEYLKQRDLSEDPLDNPPETPLIANLNGIDPVTPSSLYKSLRTLFQSAADALRKDGRAQEAKTFDRASVHWLRHSRGSHLGSAGVPPNLIQKLLGHASLSTTSIYTESDDERLWQELTDMESDHAA